MRSFCDHDRCAADLVAVLQRNRIVGRVGNHHVGGRDRGHHAATGGFALQTADASLDHRVALGFLGLLPHFVLGHHQLLVVIPQLERHVDQHDQQHCADDGHQARANQMAHLRYRGIDRLRAQRHHQILFMPDHPGSDTADQYRFGDRLGQFHQRLHRKHPCNAGKRIDLGKIRLQGFNAEQPAVQQQRGKCRSQHDGEQQGRKGDQGIQCQIIEMRNDQPGIERQLPVDAQAGAQRFRHVPGE